MINFTHPLHLFASSCKSDKLRSDYEKDLNTLLISTTNKCPLQCAHCCVNATVDGEIGIDALLLKNRLEEFYNTNNKTEIFRNVVLTGGEPFLRKDIINLVSEICSLYSLSFGIVTGCFWGKNKPSLYFNLLKTIKKSNGYLCISIDKHHLEEIGRDAYHAALALCKEINIPVRIFYAYDPNLTDEEQSIQDFILNLLISYENIVSVWPQPIRSVGRFSENESKTQQHPSSCHLVNAPNIDIDGSYYPCCGDWHDHHIWNPSSKKKLSLGNLSTCTLDSLVQSHKNSLFVNAIKEKGPWALAKQYSSDFSNKCQGLCDTCEFSISFMKNPHTLLQ